MKELKFDFNPRFNVNIKPIKIRTPHFRSMLWLNCSETERRPLTAFYNIALPQYSNTSVYYK